VAGRFDPKQLELGYPELRDALDSGVAATEFDVESLENAGFSLETTEEFHSALWFSSSSSDIQNQRQSFGFDVCLEDAFHLDLTPNLTFLKFENGFSLFIFRILCSFAETSPESTAEMLLGDMGLVENWWHPRDTF
jgi:hypothetical protein